MSNQVMASGASGRVPGASDQPLVRAALAGSSAESHGWKLVRAVWRRILRASRSTPRRLRLCENLPLGEHRFVAVVEFEQARFLVGGTSAGLVLLARLENAAREIPSPNPSEPPLSEERP